MRELLDPDRGGIGGSVRSGEAEERLETLAQRREELSKVKTLYPLSVYICERLLPLIFILDILVKDGCGWFWDGTKRKERSTSHAAL